MGNLTQATSIRDMERIVQGTAVTATGTAIDFTNIPSWVKRVSVKFDGVSINGTSGVLVQLGDNEGIENTGYVSSGNTTTSTVGTIGSNSGFVIRSVVSSFGISGTMNIDKVSDYRYVSSHSVSFDLSNAGNGGGKKTLSATLDRIRITTVNGTDTFDAGQINIMYEG